jgi:CRP-like cAMP-binding protein
MPDFEEIADDRYRSSPFASELIAHLRPFAVFHTTVVGERLDHTINGEAMCYLILEGSVASYRRDDETLLFTVQAPALFGIGNVTDVFFDEYCKVITPGLTGVISVEKAREVVETHNLWNVVSQHIMHVTNRLYKNMLHRIAPSAYEIIRGQLIDLMREEDTFRKSVTAERYIRDKTHLSRSGVMRILADLKTGGFIEMEEGRLIKINKLPARY